MVSYDSIKFAGHGGLLYRDVFLVCHVISKNHVIKGSCDYGWEFLVVSHHPTKFGSRRHCDTEDMMFLICHYCVSLKDMTWLAITQYFILARSW